MCEKKEKEYLALFDLDGTLFDTGDVNYYSYQDALQPYGVELDRGYFIKECNGRHYTEFLPVIMGTEKYIEEVHKAKKAAYANHLNRAQVNFHLFQLIQSMRNQYDTAVVTTASRKNTMDILGHFGYIDYFDLIITQEDITRVKPDPEGFIKAMDFFQKDAAHTVIFEDSEAGLQAAKSAGAAVFAVQQFGAENIESLNSICLPPNSEFIL